MRVVEKAEIAPLEPLLVSIDTAVTMIGRSKRSIVDMIARGQIQAVKSDRRTLVVYQSLKDYVAGTPKAKGTVNPRPKAASAFAAVPA